MGSKLISIGCSFTDHKYYWKAYRKQTPKDHIFWDQYLAEYLGLELCNYGLSGAGSDQHLSDLIKAIAEHGTDIEAIVFAWSSWDRYNYPYIDGPESVNPHYNGKYDADSYNALAFDKINNVRKKPLAAAAHTTAYACMYAAIKMADAIGAKIMITQLLTPTHIHLPHKYSKKGQLRWVDDNPMTSLRFLYNISEENPVYKALEKDDRVVGFPFLKRLNGFFIWDWPQGHGEMVGQKLKVIIGSRQDKIRWRDGKEEIVAEIDAHPNVEGQKLIFEKIKDHWDELYK